MDWASYLLLCSTVGTIINHPSSVWRHCKRKNYTHHYYGNTVIFKNKKAKLLFQKLILELQFLQSPSPHR